MADEHHASPKHGSERDAKRPAKSAAGRDAALGLAYMLAHHGWPLKVPTGHKTPREIWESSDAALVRLLDLPGPAIGKLLGFRRKFGRKAISAAWDDLKRKQIEVVALGDADYPKCLSQIHDPPPALFFKGTQARLDEFLSRPRVAIVGARAASRYGLDAARLLAEHLSRAGVCIISGMAMGVDAAAHRGSLPAGGGTITVLGCGVDVIYPRTNIRLYHEILKSGLVVSEYPPGTEPNPWRFPARNRIIAGLADGVVVVEAREKSGALITADFSLEQGREVWAVPGSVFSELSQGPHRLIRLGASAATSALDVLEDLGINADEKVSGGHAKKAPDDLSNEERRIFEALGSRPVHQDVIAREARVDGARAAAALISLELKGLAHKDPAGGYRL